jgi:MerR family mercuric resistance operon transcriptional regulator
MNPLTIGQVAKESGVGVETIRFYEREGLIAKPPRRPSGYRQYDRDVIRRIRFIQRGKDLGFSLREIAELLSLRLTRGRSCADVKARATAKIEDIESKVAVLERMKEALTRLAAACAGKGSVSECPILDALDAEDTHAER